MKKYVRDWLRAIARYTSLALFFPFSSVALVACEAHPQLDVLSQILVGSELKILIETSVLHPAWIADGHQETDHYKGWLIAVDLVSNAPLTERTPVYGPLWDRPAWDTPDSEHTRFRLDDEGNVVRFRDPISGGFPSRSVLTTAATTARWEQRTAYPPPAGPEIPGFWMGSGRYALHGGFDGKPALYEAYHGKYSPLGGAPISKPWLTRALSTCFDMKDMAHVTVTDDLEHIVCFIDSDSNSVLHGLPPITEPDRNGQAYSNKEFALMFHESDLNPVVFRKSAITVATENREGPSGALVIDGNLYFMRATPENDFVLFPFQGGPRYELPHDLEGWEGIGRYSYAVQPIAGNSTIAFLSRGWGPVHYQDDTTVVLWDYRNGKIARYDIPIRGLFDGHFHEIRPRHPIVPIEE
jgi:hypothetical protein